MVPTEDLKRLGRDHGFSSVTYRNMARVAQSFAEVYGLQEGRDFEIAWSTLQLHIYQVGRVAEHKGLAEVEARIRTMEFYLEAATVTLRDETGAERVARICR